MSQDFNHLEHSVEVSQKICEFETRQGNPEKAIEVYKRIIFKSNIKLSLKAYLLGKMVDLLKKVNPFANQTKFC